MKFIELCNRAAQRTHAKFSKFIEFKILAVQWKPNLSKFIEFRKSAAQWTPLHFILLNALDALNS